jgi:hypothetical protein
MAQGFTKDQEAELTLRLDDVGSGTTYIGEAIPGTLTSVALWRIKRMVETGPDIVILWADGNENFDNEWDERAGLSYS